MGAPAAGADGGCGPIALTTLPRRLREAWVPAALLILLAAQVTVGTTLHRNGSSWFMAPDDHEAYFMTRQVAETGFPTWRSDLDLPTNDSLHMPRGSVYVNGHVTSYRGVGAFYVNAPFYLVHPSLVFLVPALMGVLATLLVFLVGRELAGETAGVAAATLFGLSPHALFWSNFLFSNLYALPFFLGGLFLLLRAERLGGRAQTWTRISGFALLWAAGLFRSEYWLFDVVVAGAFLVLGRGWLRVRPLLTMAPAGLLLLAVTAGISYGLYGTVNLTASADPSYIGTVPESDSQAEVLFGRIETSRIVDSILAYALATSPAFAVGALAMAVLPLRKPAPGPLVGVYVLAAAGIVGFSLYFFGGNIYNTGFGIPLSSSYARYFLLPLALLAVPAGLLLGAFAGRGGATAKALVAALLAASASAGVAGALDPEAALPAMEERLLRYKALDEAAAALPETAVIVGDLPNRMILSRPVVSPQFIETPDRASELARIVDHLLATGREVYLVKGWSRDDQSGNLENMLAERFAFRRDAASSFIQVVPVTGGAA